MSWCVEREKRAVEVILKVENWKKSRNLNVERNKEPPKAFWAVRRHYEKWWFREVNLIELSKWQWKREPCENLGVGWWGPWGGYQREEWKRRASVKAAYEGRGSNRTWWLRRNRLWRSRSEPNNSRASNQGVQRREHTYLEKGSGRGFWFAMKWEKMMGCVFVPNLFFSSQVCKTA